MKKFILFLFYLFIFSCVFLFIWCCFPIVCKGSTVDMPPFMPKPFIYPSLGIHLWPAAVPSFITNLETDFIKYCPVGPPPVCYCVKLSDYKESINIIVHAFPAKEANFYMEFFDIDSSFMTVNQVKTDIISDNENITRAIYYISKKEAYNIDRSCVCVGQEPKGSGVIMAGKVIEGKSLNSNNQNIEIITEPAVDYNY